MNAWKLVVAVGIGLIVLGLGMRWLKLGRLPGDIVIERENARFYFPIVTCLVLSLVGSVVLAIVRWWSK